MRVLTAAEMRAFDRAAIEEVGVPGMVLMENAAIGVADAIGERYPGASRVAIFCGPGNNGGDGFALARHLSTRGYQVAAFAVGDRSAATGDAATQRAVCARLAISISPASDADTLAAAVAAAGDADLVVDALFGTGLSRPLAGLFADAVEGINSLAMPRVAVDLPSGLDASTPAVTGPTVRAHLTVTFAAPKVAHVLPPASDWVGELAVTDLGVPLALPPSETPGLELLELEEAAALLLPRPADGHKGTFGHALIVAGGPGKAGAAVLCARSAVRAGAGLVTVATAAEILSQVATGSIESMTLPLPCGPGGLDNDAVVAILAAAKGKDALAVGPGLGTERGTAAAVRALLSRCELPVVLDADGLNAFAGRAGELRARPAPTLITPHPGEAARLLDVPIGELERDRLAAVRRLAAETGCTVVLKGHPTLIATPSGDVSIAATGNVVLASGGTGDVLTGVLASLLAQGYEPLAAAKLGVTLHGLAGDRWVTAHGERGFAAADLVDTLPAAFAALAGGEAPE